MKKIRDILIIIACCFAIVTCVILISKNVDFPDVSPERKEETKGTKFDIGDCKPGNVYFLCDDGKAQFIAKQDNIIQFKSNICVQNNGVISTAPLSDNELTILSIQRWISKKADRFLFDDKVYCDIKSPNADGILFAQSVVPYTEFELGFRSAENKKEGLAEYRFYDNNAQVAFSIVQDLDYFAEGVSPSDILFEDKLQVLLEAKKNEANKRKQKAIKTLKENQNYCAVIEALCIEVDNPLGAAFVFDYDRSNVSTTRLYDVLFYKVGNVCIQIKIGYSYGEFDGAEFEISEMQLTDKADATDFKYEDISDEYKKIYENVNKLLDSRNA